MKNGKKYLLSRDLRCPSCNSLLILDAKERLSGKASCPECEAFLDHSEFTPVGKDHIYCSICHSPFLKTKDTCPDCGARNTYFDAPEADSEEHPFLFRTMITGELISIIYVLGAILISLISLAILAFGFYVESAGMCFLGFSILFVGNIIWRLLCERSILFFSIHKILGKILGELEYLNEQRDSSNNIEPEN